jgi:hypothetical protein
MKDEVELSMLLVGGDLLPGEAHVLRKPIMDESGMPEDSRTLS